MATKTSIGVILCRRSPATGRPEALLAHKRYTYAFAEFVHGRYTRGRAGSNAALRCVAPLFDRMTREELFDILSLNFGQMWYRIWLTVDNRDLYNRKNAKFQTTFMRDGGDALRRLVALARATGVVLWEVPRGRRLGERESDILCAARELREETGVEKSEYRFLPGVKRRVSYVSGGTRYVCAYYVALANPRLSGAVGHDDPALPTLRELYLMAEVSEVRWFDVERIRLIDCADSRLEALVAPAFRLMKQYLRGRWAFRRPAVAPPSAAILRPPPAPAAPAPAVASPAVAVAVASPAVAVAAPAVASPAPAENGWRLARKGARGKPYGRQGALAPAPRDAGEARADHDWRTGARPAKK